MTVRSDIAQQSVKAPLESLGCTSHLNLLSSYLLTLTNTCLDAGKESFPTLSLRYSEDACYCLMEAREESVLEDLNPDFIIATSFSELFSYNVSELNIICQQRQSVIEFFAALR